MNLLFVINDGLRSTFYLFQLDDEKKMLIRIRPEIRVADLEIVEQYLDKSEVSFIEWFANEFELSKLRFLILGKEELARFLFEKQKQIEVSNPSSFTSKTNEFLHYPKGKQLLNRESFAEFITYDKSYNDEVFTRQEHILRLIKDRILEEGNSLAIPKRFSEFRKLVKTDLTLRNILLFFKKYQSNKSVKIVRKTL